MVTRFTGGCLCSRVRYECFADPLFMGNCHCRDCQKASGGGYEPDIGLPAAALKITGPVKYYDCKADSGNTLSRGFCPECGASLFGKTSAVP
ncbi:MAG: GFA family protein, partial [Chloroflexota bacterium]